MNLFFAIFPLFSLIPVSSAWGNLTHRTVALLALAHLTPSANLYTTSLLPHESLPSAALWADTYKHLPAGRHSLSWHYISTHDSPPSHCSVSYMHDCLHDNSDSEQHPCLITAIANMTRRVNDHHLVRAQRAEALKFLLHLLADLHNPLHVGGQLRGGNDIMVRWEGRDTNLHFVWDVLMPQRRTNSSEGGEDEEEAAAAWAEQLLGGMRRRVPDTAAAAAAVVGTAAAPGLFHNVADEEIWDLQERTEELAEAWAAEVNAWVCRMVLRDGVDGVMSRELSGTYYVEAVPIIEELVSKAGWRLAAWINELAREEEELERHGREQGELK